MPALANDAAVAEQCNRDGNRALREKDFLSAVKSYTQGLENAANDELRSVLFSNRSSAYAHLERWQDALDDANSCRDVRPGWYRSHACRGAALEGLARPSEALDAFRTALQMDPANAELRSIVEELEELEKVRVPQSSLKVEGEAISDMYTANGAPPHSSQGGEPQTAPELEGLEKVQVPQSSMKGEASEREYMGPAFCNRIPGIDKRGGVGMALVLHPHAGANGQGDVFVDGLLFFILFFFCFLFLTPSPFLQARTSRTLSRSLRRYIYTHTLHVCVCVCMCVCVCVNV